MGDAPRLLEVPRACELVDRRRGIAVGGKELPEQAIEGSPVAAEPLHDSVHVVYEGIIFFHTVYCTPPAPNCTEKTFKPDFFSVDD
jgi:hypothetical protein